MSGGKKKKLHVKDIYDNLIYKSKINENKLNAQEQKKLIIQHHYIIKQLLNLSEYVMLFSFYTNI